MARLKHYEKTTRVGTWISLGNENLIRLLELDATRWSFEFDLSKYMFASNEGGGLIAVYGKGIARMENNIYLFTSSGTPHSAAPKIRLPDPQEVLFMCWNQMQDHLIVVLNDRTVRVLNYSGDPVALELKLDSIPLVFASTGTGFVGVTSFTGEKPASLYFVHFTEREGYTLRVVELPSVFQKIVPTTTLLAVPAVHSETGYPEVFIPCSTTPLFSGVYRCAFSPAPKIVDLKLSIGGGAIKKMDISPAGTSVAFVMEDGSLYFANRSLEEVIKSTEQVELCGDVLWCGENCVVCHFTPDAADYRSEQTSTILVTNPNDPSFFDYIYDLPADLKLFRECDGLRLLSSENFYQFLQVIPPEARRVFSVGSRATSAVLLATFDEFMSGAAASAVSSIRDMRERNDELSRAINDCVTAAATEFDSAQQKRLLRIAAFGKSFSPAYDTNCFVNTSRRIRARNTLGSSGTGVVITEEQLQALGEAQLLRRLTQGNHHQLAHAICKELGLKSEDVMTDWAMAKLTSGMRNHPGHDQEKLYAKKIVTKIKALEPTMPFAELARLANARGYKVAALVFLETEPNASRQVPMLLTIGEPERALKHAVDANDGDLIFTVISQLLASKGTQATSIISMFPEARSLLLEYMNVSESHRDIMTGFFNQQPECQTALGFQTYFQEEKRLRKGFTSARSLGEVNWEMLQECKSAAAQSLITSVHKELEKGRKSSATPAGVPFSSSSLSTAQTASNEKFLRQHLNVLQDQARLMRELDDPRFLTASVADMVRYTLEHGRASLAAKLKSDYSIPEKVYQRCMLTAYSQTGQWDLIDDLGGISSRTQPLIAGEVFVTLLLSFGRPQQARQYIPRIDRIELRMEYYVQCGDWYSAAADCRKHGETDLVTQLRDRAKGDASILAQISDGWNSQQEATNKLSRLFGSGA